MSWFPSKRNPAYVNMVDESGDAIGTVGNPLVTTAGGGGSAQEVTVVGSDTLYAGNLSAITTAQPLGASQAISEVLIQNSPTSGENVFVGSATNQPIVLVPGASISIQVDDLAKVYAKAATNTADIGYLGRS